MIHKAKSVKSFKTDDWCEMTMLSCNKERPRNNMLLVPGEETQEADYYCNLFIVIIDLLMNNKPSYAPQRKHTEEFTCLIKRKQWQFDLKLPKCCFSLYKINKTTFNCEIMWWNYCMSFIYNLINHPVFIHNIECKGF